MFGSRNDEKDIYSPETQNRSATAPGILIITDSKVEDLEFFYPYYRFIEAGYRVDVATPDGEDFEGKHGIELQTSKKLSDVRAENYALLYLPGGKAPASLKDNEDVLNLVRNFAKANKPIAAICHGPQILAAADVIKGKRISAFPEVEDEIEDAGGTYENAECLTDGLFTTARWPGDLPAHMKKVLDLLQNSKNTTTEARDWTTAA